jgi:uncharacterized protein YjdB
MTVQSGIRAGVRAGATSGLNPGLQIVGVSISPAATGCLVAGTRQLVATATYNDGSTEDVSTTATWSSSNTSKATVDSTGLVTGVAAGVAIITARSGSAADAQFYGQSTVTVV